MSPDPVTGSLPVPEGYAGIGGVSVLAGAVLSTRAKLSRRTRNLVQHAAASTVLAGLVVDVLAKLLHRTGQLTATAAGIVVGLAGMLAIRVLAGGQGKDGQSSLVVTILTDVLVDGVLIGPSAALGYRTGLLFAIALASELALLGVTATNALINRWPAGRLIGTAVGIGAAITTVDALGGLTAQAAPALATAVLGLGPSVIVYLITKELLREAHESDTGPGEVAVLFGCFLPLFLTGIATG